MFELFANSGDPDQTWHSVASDLGLHCLPVTRFRGLQPSMGLNIMEVCLCYFILNDVRTLGEDLVLVKLD